MKVSRGNYSDHAPVSDYNRGYLDGAEWEKARADARAKREADDERRAGGAELVLDEGDRQLVLLALAKLSLERPGFDYALNEIAKRVDNVDGDRARMYDAFRKIHGAE